MFEKRTFLVFVGLIALSAAAIDPDNICILLSDGSKIVDDTSCAGYYTCKGGKASAATCPNGYFFNKDTKSCVPKAESKCISGDEAPCVGVADGKFVGMAGSCSGYYYCKNQVGAAGQCPNNLNFNPSEQKCMYESEYKCTIAGGGADTETDVDIINDPDLLCNYVPEGVYFGNAESCSEWHKCQDGVLKSGTCGAYVFNVQTQACVYKSTYDCPQLNGDSSQTGGLSQDCEEQTITITVKKTSRNNGAHRKRLYKPKLVKRKLIKRTIVKFKPKPVVILKKHMLIKGKRVARECDPTDTECTEDCIVGQDPDCECDSTEDSCDQQTCIVGIDENCVCTEDDESCEVKECDPDTDEDCKCQEGDESCEVKECDSETDEDCKCQEDDESCEVKECDPDTDEDCKCEAGDESCEVKECDPDTDEDCKCEAGDESCAEKECDPEAGDNCEVCEDDECGEVTCDPDNEDCDEGSDEDGDKEEVITVPKKLKDPTSCSSYLTCVKKKLVKTNCISGQYFSLTDQQCTPRAEAVNRCDRCEGTTQTFVNAANDDCLGYIYCKNGVNSGTGKCPTDYYFNENLGSCVPSNPKFKACLNSSYIEYDSLL